MVTLYSFAANLECEGSRSLGYLGVWKVLEKMIADLRKKGLAVPDKVMKDLKSARTMIKILDADPTRGETIQKIDVYLENVESYIVSEAQKKFGVEYADEWLKRLDKASRQTFDEEEEARFVSGVPRGQKWIRVKPLDELPIEKLKTLAEESNLSYNIQKDGFLLVHGKDEDIKHFVKKMSAKPNE